MSTDYADAQAVAFLDSWLEFQSRERGFPGFIVGVLRGSRMIFAHAYGVANMTTGEPLTLDHCINIGSQAKMFTATAIMQHIEAGKLTLDDRAVRFLPWLRQHRDPQFQHITIRHLLWHGAGIVHDGAIADFWQLRKPFPDAKAFRQIILSSDIVMETGLKLKYSNLGFALLGEIVEIVSGQPYAAYVIGSILAPLDMSHTLTADIADNSVSQATGYTHPIAGERLAISKYLPTRQLSPATGWLSTVADMGVFMAAQLPGDARILSEASKRELHANRRHHWQSKTLRGSEHGLGFFVHQFAAREVVGYHGGFCGYRSSSLIDLTDKLSVIVFATAKDAPVMQMSRGIFGVFDFFTAHARQPTKPERAKFSGRLMGLWSALDIVVTNDRIVAVYPDEWVPLANITEELTQAGPDSLRIIRAHDTMPIVETILFNFRNNQIRSANHAGETLLPEASYRTWLRNNWLYES